MLAIAAVIIMISVYQRSASTATWVVAILSAASFFGGGQIYFLFTHPTLQMGLISVGYLFFGVVWSLIHWTLWVKEKAEWLSSHNTTKKESVYHEAVEDYSLQANIGRVVSWIFYWPFDIPFTILFGPLKRLGNWCVKSLSGIYNSIAESILKRALRV